MKREYTKAIRAAQDVIRLQRERAYSQKPGETLSFTPEEVRYLDAAINLITGASMDAMTGDTSEPHLMLVLILVSDCLAHLFNIWHTAGVRNLTSEELPPLTSPRGHDR